MKKLILSSAIGLLLASYALGQVPSGPGDAAMQEDMPPPIPAELATQPVFNPERVYVDAEYLLWWLKHEGVPPLIGSAAAADVAGGQSVPVSEIHQLFGGEHPINFGAFSGGRFLGGLWLDPESHIAIEGGGFFLDRREKQFGASTPGDPVIGGLFNDATNGDLTILTPTDPTNATESATGTASERLYGAEGNVRYRLAYFGQSTLDVFAGYRYMDIASNLSYGTTTDFEGEGVRVRTNQFDANTRFSGGQIGGRLDLHRDAWTLDLQGKLGIGTVHEVVDINGQTVDTLVDGTVFTYPGGILALPSNIGHYSRSRFALLPEMTVNMGYQFNRYVRAFVGFNWLELTLATRVSDAIDATVNSASIPGVTVNNPQTINRPTFHFTDSDFWALGMNFGLEFRY
jgi:hypothetical protein